MVSEWVILRFTWLMKRCGASVETICSVTNYLRQRGIRQSFTNRRTKRCNKFVTLFSIVDTQKRICRSAVLLLAADLIPGNVCVFVVFIGHSRNFCRHFKCGRHMRVVWPTSLHYMTEQLYWHKWTILGKKPSREQASSGRIQLWDAVLPSNRIGDTCLNT
jgi:hypothetical protein